MSRFSGLDSGREGPIILGFRAEDAAIDPAGSSAAPLYSLELLGDATIATMRLGGTIASVRSAKDYRAQIGDRVAVSIPPEACHLFDATSGERLS